MQCELLVMKSPFENNFIAQVNLLPARIWGDLVGEINYCSPPAAAGGSDLFVLLLRLRQVMKLITLIVPINPEPSILKLQSYIFRFHKEPKPVCNVD